jgi:hypothetical protein
VQKYIFLNIISAFYFFIKKELFKKKCYDFPKENHPFSESVSALYELLFLKQTFLLTMNYIQIF